MIRKQSSRIQLDKNAGLKDFLSSFLVLIAFGIAWPMSASASTPSGDVKINEVSLTQYEDSVLIQTAPRHALDGQCSSDYWLMLNKTSAGTNFDYILSMVLTAKAADMTVIVVANDVGHAQYCELERIILRQRQTHSRKPVTQLQNKKRTP